MHRRGQRNSVSADNASYNNETELTTFTPRRSSEYLNEIGYQTDDSEGYLESYQPGEGYDLIDWDNENDCESTPKNETEKPPYNGIFANAVTLLNTRKNDATAQSISQDLQIIAATLLEWKTKNKNAAGSLSYTTYEKELEKAASELANCFTSNNEENKQAAKEKFLKVAQTNRNLWNQILLGTFGAIVIICITGFALPAASLIAFKLLSGGTLINAILSTFTPAVVTTTPGQIAIGVGFIVSHFSLRKFYSWMSQPTPAQMAAKEIKDPLEKLHPSYKKS